MTTKAFLVLLAGVLLAALSAALSVRALVYVSVLLGLVFFYALVSVWLARKTTRVYATVAETQVLRGDSNFLRLKAVRKSILPAGGVTICWRDGNSLRECVLWPGLRGEAQAELPLNTRHVGTYEMKVEYVRWEDLYGLFSMRKKGFKPEETMVLPRPFDIEKPTFAVGEEGIAALRLASEDYNAPDDMRAFRPGDPLKRVHWKLYARKGELLVRQYEAPMPPDTLILLDCGKPRGGTEEIQAKFQDTLCETAVAVADLQMKDGQKVRMPLYGQDANEFVSDRQEHLLLLQRMLAAQRFGTEEDFSRAVREEMKKVRRCGAVVAVTTRMTAEATDALCDLRRLGPNVRCYLVTDQMERAEDLPYIGQLQHHLVEVCYVTPA